MSSILEAVSKGTDLKHLMKEKRECPIILMLKKQIMILGHVRM